MLALRGYARAWLLLCLATSACADEEEPAGQPLPGLDSGLPDGGGSLDASVSVDGGLLSPDAMAIASGCGVDEVAEVSRSALDPESPLGVDVNNKGATLSWISFVQGKSRLTSRWLGTRGGGQETPGAEGDLAQLEPVVTAVGTGFLSVWTEQVGGHYNLRAQRTGQQGEALDSVPTGLTQDDADNHEPVLALGADGNVLVVWQAHQPSLQGKALLIDSTSSAVGSAQLIPALTATAGRPALAALGTGYVLAWVDAALRQVHLQKLDASGKPVGSSARVDAEGGAHGNVDMATTEQGGAVTFDVLVDGVRPEVRFRSFDADATPTGPEQIVTSYPDKGLSPSIVAFRGGYALAYRSAESAQQQLRLALVRSSGVPLRTIDIATVTSINFPVVLRATPDGTRMFVGWLDSVPDSTTYQLQRAWIHCD
jgi:hypothetical protein